MSEYDDKCTKIMRDLTGTLKQSYESLLKERRANMKVLRKDHLEFNEISAFKELQNKVCTHSLKKFIRKKEQGKSGWIDTDSEDRLFQWLLAGLTRHTRLIDPEGSFSEDDLIDAINYLMMLYNIFPRLSLKRKEE